jgi:calcium-dependent protein kinase
VTVSIHLKKIRSEDHLPKVFSYFDKNGSGYIEIEELKEALSPRGDQKAIDDIISDVDKDKVISNSAIPSSQELANYYSTDEHY